MAYQCDIAAGKALLSAERYTEAFAALFSCAEDGNSEAQAAIGVMFQLGLGTSRNLPEAMRWLKLAASAGIGEAAHNLGTLFLTCEPDLPRDEEESRYWFMQAKAMEFVVSTDDWHPKK